MQTSGFHRLARGVGALILAMTPGLAIAQDGKQATGDPVTKPETNRLRPRPETSTPPPRTSREVLPGVPATPADPAPTGTRAVPSGTAGQAAGDQAATVDGRATAAGGPVRVAPGIMYTEGVVTKLSKPGKAISGELIRFTLDPSQGWEVYANQRSTKTVPGRVERSAAKPRDDSKSDGDADDSDRSADRDKPKPVDLVITGRTRMVSFARTPEGEDVVGAATQSTPEQTYPRTGPARNARAGPKETNFTNIKEGSFVAVRYRRAGDRNEVVNLSLIEFPLLAPGEGPETRPTGGTVPPPTPPTTRPATGVAPGSAPRTTTDGTAPGSRVPRVPNTPTGPALPR